MQRRNLPRDFARKLMSSVAAAAVAATTMAPLQQAAAQSNARPTRTPIKHVIVIMGENRSFDHVFATYKPVHGQTVSNLLSKGIVNADGTPGPHYQLALQNQAFVMTSYEAAPATKKPYSVLPPALTGGPSTPSMCQALGVTTGTSCVTPANIAAVKAIENGLPDEYYQYLLTGGTGQPGGVPDARINYAGKDASHLPPGPYQLTSATYPYDAFGPSPVHRFFQMTQQLDCGARDGDHDADDHLNPFARSSCASDLFAWVEQTVAAGSNGAARPANYQGEGSTSMGFYNVLNGDAPYLKELADTYSMSDNYHQGVNGGTGANHVMLGAADAIWFSDGNGHAQVPPNNPVDPNNPGTPPNGVSALAEIENPNPQPGTNNFFIQDGYGGGSGSPTAKAPSANYGGGSYVNCADPRQPGVASVLSVLSSSVHPVASRCEPGHYYLVNNYNPGYFGDGSNAYTDTNANNFVYTIPPSTLRTIGDSLSESNVSWAYYGDDFNAYLNDKYQLQWNSGKDQYCNICNWAQYATSIMTNASARTEHVRDTADLYQAIQSGNLPAVSYVKPSGLLDGHPASSKLNLYEGFVKKIVDGVKANPTLWSDTAIFVTFDEGGGYWDSGYVQQVDFFGDGTRVPMIAVSKYSTGGRIAHSYTDHASVVKFIEANWGLRPVTARSRDNLPNPIAVPTSPYVPLNQPAIGDMMDLFDFDGPHGNL